MSFAISGHLLYTTYGTPFGPGADFDLVFLSFSFNSLSVGGWSFSGISGSVNVQRLSFAIRFHFFPGHCELYSRMFPLLL